jgi:hypothetical protein
MPDSGLALTARGSRLILKENNTARSENIAAL